MLGQVVQIPLHVTMMLQLLQMTVLVLVFLKALVIVTETYLTNVAFVVEMILLVMTLVVLLTETALLVLTVVAFLTETVHLVAVFVALVTMILLVMDVPMPMPRTTLRQRPLTMDLAYMQCVTSHQTIKRLTMLELLLSSAQTGVAVVLAI